MARLGLAGMAGAGLAALRRYPRLVLALYAVQLITSAVAGLVVARGLAAVLAHRPAADAAASGDLFALIVIVRDHAPLLSALAWTCLALVILYAVISWFTTAGLLATLTEGPRDRRATAQAFGAGAAANGLAFARLWLWSLIPYAVALFITVLALGPLTGDLGDILHLGDLIGSLLPGLIPAALVWWIVNTAVDFARVNLVRRQRKSALRALLRGFADIFTDWKPLPHAAFYYLLFLAVTATFWAGTSGAALSATGLLVIRQLVAVTRFCGKVWLHGGQVELTRRRRDEPRA
jgi:hypothetical protein